jgi:hypothetical protein
MFVSSRWSPMGSNSNAGCDESFKHRLSGTGGKHGAPWSETRSVVGHSRRLGLVCGTSGLPQTADISGPGRHFAFVPEGDIALLDSAPRPCVGSQYLGCRPFAKNFAAEVPGSLARVGARRGRLGTKIATSHTASTVRPRSLLESRVGCRSLHAHPARLSARQALRSVARQGHRHG